MTGQLDGQPTAALEAEIAQLRAALETRTVIGQATGIFMERYDIDAERAFSALVRMSQQNNRKLRELAAELVSERNRRGDSDQPTSSHSGGALE